MSESRLSLRVDPKPSKNIPEYFKDFLVRYLGEHAAFLPEEMQKIIFMEYLCIAELTPTLFFDSVDGSAIRNMPGFLGDTVWRETGPFLPIVSNRDVFFQTGTDILNTIISDVSEQRWHLDEVLVALHQLIREPLIPGLVRFNPEAKDWEINLDAITTTNSFATKKRTPSSVVEPSWNAIRTEEKKPAESKTEIELQEIKVDQKFEWNENKSADQASEDDPELESQPLTTEQKSAAKEEKKSTPFLSDNVLSVLLRVFPNPLTQAKICRDPMLVAFFNALDNARAAGRKSILFSELDLLKDQWLGQQYYFNRPPLMTSSNIQLTPLPPIADSMPIPLRCQRIISKPQKCERKAAHEILVHSVACFASFSHVLDEPIRGLWERNRLLYPLGVPYVLLDYMVVEVSLRRLLDFSGETKRRYRLASWDGYFAYLLFVAAPTGLLYLSRFNRSPVSSLLSADGAGLATIIAARSAEFLDNVIPALAALSGLFFRPPQGAIQRAGNSEQSLRQYSSLMFAGIVISLSFYSVSENESEPGFPVFAMLLKSGFLFTVWDMARKELVDFLSCPRSIFNFPSPWPRRVARGAEFLELDAGPDTKAIINTPTIPQPEVDLPADRKWIPAPTYASSRIFYGLRTAVMLFTALAMLNSPTKGLLLGMFTFMLGSYISGMERLYTAPPQNRSRLYQPLTVSTQASSPAATQAASSASASSAPAAPPSASTMGMRA